MKKVSFLNIIILIFLANLVSAQTKTDRKLEVKIQKLIQDMQGDVGIYVCDLKNRK